MRQIIYELKTGERIIFVSVATYFIVFCLDLKKNTCKSVAISNVKNSQLKEEFEGSYFIELEKKWCDNQHPSYKHSDKKKYLYYLNGDSDWILSSVRCSTKVSLLFCPYNEGMLCYLLQRYIFIRKFLYKCL